MYTHDWILEVLQDLAKYAEMNDLEKFGEIILDAEIIAFAEIAGKSRIPNLHTSAVEVG